MRASVTRCFIRLHGQRQARHMHRDGQRHRLQTAQVWRKGRHLDPNGVGKHGLHPALHPDRHFSGRRSKIPKAKAAIGELVDQNERIRPNADGRENAVREDPRQDPPQCPGNTCQRRAVRYTNAHSQPGALLARLHRERPGIPGSSARPAHPVATSKWRPGAWIAARPGKTST